MSKNERRTSNAQHRILNGKKMDKFKTLMIIGALLFCITAFGQPFEYKKYSGETVIFSWDAVQEAETYTVRVKNVSNVTVTEHNTVATQFEFYIPMVGVYEFQVKACNIDGCCSIFSLSTDPSVAKVDGSARAWVVRAEMAPPGKPIIE